MGGEYAVIEDELRQYVLQHKVDDIYSAQTRYLLILESPHVAEIHTGIPLSGLSGKAVTKALCPYLGSVPFGVFAKMNNGNPIGIMNVVCAPLQSKRATGSSFDVLDSIRKKYSRTSTPRLSKEEETIFGILMRSFSRRLDLARKLSPSVKLIACGKFAQSFCRQIASKKEELLVQELPHPAHSGWSYTSKKNESIKGQLTKILTELRQSMPIEFIRKMDAPEYLSRMYNECNNLLKIQNSKYHLISSKRVSACVRLDDEYITEQNVGISKVTGSLCAERNAILKVISLKPGVTPERICQLFVLGESGTLLPCGVCCEWLNKINPDMDIFTEFGEEFFLRVKLREYYGDEKNMSLIEKSYIRIHSIDFRGSICDGPGIRSVVYVQGCLRRCYNCHNPETWDLAAGKEYNVLDLVQLIHKNTPTRRITISGGEPLLQLESVQNLIERLNGLKYDIALYTGMEYSEIPKTVISGINYIKCGPYIDSLKTTTHYYGSDNQHFIEIMSPSF